MLKLGNILEGVLLSENKLYGRKLIDIITRKIGDNSEATLNQLSIAGLFRGSFGDIQKLASKEELQTASDEWYNAMIEKMLKTSAFSDNEDSAKKYLNAYIKNVGSLGEKAAPFSIKKIERGLVDLVNNNGWIEDEPEPIGHDIYNPSDDDIKYEDDNILVLDSDTKAKCVKYGKDESWCIGKPELNYYNTYRITQGATPYHVLQKKLDKGDRNHKLVIMVYGENRFSIADRDNDVSGHHGGSGQAQSWLGIEDAVPGLTGLKEYFPYRGVTDDERRYNQILSARVSENDLMGYIVNVIEGLNVNGSPVTPEDFIRDYAATGVEFSMTQLRSLSESVMDSLIEAGYFVTKLRKHYDRDIVTDRQIRRIAKIRIENNVILQYFEIETLKDRERQAYIDEHVRDIQIINSLKQSEEPEKVMELFGTRALTIVVGLPPYETQQLITESRDTEVMINLSLDYRLANPDLGYTDNDNLLKYNLVYLKLSEHPSKILKKLGHSGKLFLSLIHNNDMDALLQAAKNSDEIIQAYIDIKGASTLGHGSIHMLLVGADNPEKVYKMIGRNGPIFFSTLDSSSMMGLIRTAKEPDKLSQMIGDDRIERMILELTPEEVVTFHGSVRGEKRDKLAQMIIRLKGANLTDDEISRFLVKGTNPDSLIDNIIEVKGDGLNGSNVHSIMHASHDSDSVANKIIIALGDKLDEQGIRAILKRAPSTEAFTAKIIEMFGSRLDSKTINVMLEVAINPDGAAAAIIRAKGDSLGPKEAFVLLHYSNNPSVTAKLFSEGTLAGLMAIASGIGSTGIEGMAVNAKNPHAFTRVMNQIMNFQTVESIKSRLRSELLL